jgi:hypothetical protein
MPLFHHLLEELRLHLLEEHYSKSVYVPVAVPTGVVEAAPVSLLTTFKLLNQLGMFTVLSFGLHSTEQPVSLRETKVEYVLLYEDKS